ncbi:MAG: autotransporter domain-containing protein [Cyclobacteriaceae bacterium]|nr:autotransporter domain-containing protein [Cyclobacteriaceae bacterium]
MATTALFAQFTGKGTVLLGGSSNLGFSSISSETKTSFGTYSNGKHTNFTISPQAGYFLIDNLAIGAQISLGFSKYKSPSGNVYNESTTQVMLTPFLRYYYQKFYLQASAGFGSIKSKSDYSGEYKSKISSVGAALGYVILLSDQVGLEPQLGYSVNTSKDLNDYKSTDSGLTGSLGLFIYLAR